MAVEIDKLYTRNRFSGGPNILFLTLYAPIGILLLILRVFISLQLCLACFILPSGTMTRKFVLRILYSVMGIIVQEIDCEKRDSKCRVLVANHVTPFDHVAVSIIYPCISVSSYNLPMPISSMFCCHNFGAYQGREVIRSNMQSYLNKPGSLPLILYPEGSMTSGNVALMKYNSWAFDIEKSVLALGLKVRRLPILHIAPSVLGASLAADLFYLLFSPVTIFSIRYVGKFSRAEDESPDEFALRVQQATASVLNIDISPHSVNDKLEYLKRLKREEAMAADPLLSPGIHSMALQVKEVLPYLSLDAIKRDLVRTRNVDLTITNFLEGNMPEPFPSSILDSSGLSNSPPSSSQSVSSYPNSSNISLSGFGTELPPTSQDLNMAAKTFGKSATERTQSFEERKRQLIEKARKRYIQKHSTEMIKQNC